jgi:hypothetical protein
MDDADLCASERTDLEKRTEDGAARNGRDSENEDSAG